MSAPSRRRTGLALLTLPIGLGIVAFTILPGAATPAVNSTSTLLARGTDRSTGTLALQRDTDVVVVMNTFAAATATTAPGSSGWHSHLGGVIVVVAQGELTLYRSVGSRCDATTYTAGQSFVERPNDVQDGVSEHRHHRDDRVRHLPRRSCRRLAEDRRSDRSRHLPRRLRIGCAGSHRSKGATVGSGTRLIEPDRVPPPRARRRGTSWHARARAHGRPRR